MIKEERTYHKSFPLDQFLNSLVDLIGRWSSIRNLESVNRVHFHDLPSTSINQWTAANQWAMGNEMMLEKENIFYVSSGAMKETTSKRLLKILKKKEGK